MTSSAEAPPRNGTADAVPERLRRPAAPKSVGLGPLLAVCGLAGGVGTTTVAYLVALAARRQWQRPVIIADTGGPTGGLAARAGVEVPRSLGELAGDLAAGAPLGPGIFATGKDGLGVLAGAPEFSTHCEPASLRQLLRDARQAHALTVVDCGTLSREADQTAAAAATHVAWILSATRHGLDRATRVLDAAPPMTRQDVIVARMDDRHGSIPVRDLRLFAAARRAPLVLVPQLEDLDMGRVDRAAEAAEVSTQAILGAVIRQSAKAAR